MEFARPETLDDALALLNAGPWKILAGGTDFYPALGERPVTDPVIDITGIAGLREISETDTHWRVGALVTWSDIVRSSLPASFEALKGAAREVGSIQIQNRATVVGNICNASPAADGVPPLLLLDAIVELRSARGQRQMPLQDFIRGNRSTQLEASELVTALLVPKSSATGVSRFAKLGARKYLVISIVMAAARIKVADDGVIGAAAVAIGACSAVARRLPSLEQQLIGKSVRDDLVGLVDDKHLAPLSPIDDVRGSADYRHCASLELVRRIVRDAAQSAGGKCA